MEYNFHPVRLAIFAACIAVFALLGGFKPLRLENPDGSSVRLDRAWTRIVLIFVAGAAAAAFVDHEVGTMDRTSLRWAYVFIGTSMMIVASLWLRSVRASGAARGGGLLPIVERVWSQLGSERESRSDFRNGSHRAAAALVAREPGVLLSPP